MRKYFNNNNFKSEIIINDSCYEKKIIVNKEIEKYFLHMI